jgi:hypothetical protein
MSSLQKNYVNLDNDESRNSLLSDESSYHVYIETQIKYVYFFHNKIILFQSLIESLFWKTVKPTILLHLFRRLLRSTV